MQQGKKMLMNSRKTTKEMYVFKGHLIKVLDFPNHVWKLFTKCMIDGDDLGKHLLAFHGHYFFFFLPK